MATPSKRFLNPLECTKQQNRLPHWRQDGATYFVTFRLSDALPSHLLTQWNDECATWQGVNPKPWSKEVEKEYYERFHGAREQWLDEGSGSCILRKSQAAEIVAEALQFFHGVRYVHHAWVIMPNHVHALFSLTGEKSVGEIVQTWKSVSSRKLAQIPQADELGSSIWQKDYFDRIIRDEEHFWAVARYISRNPAKGNLREGDYRIWLGDGVREECEPAL